MKTKRRDTMLKARTRNSRIVPKSDFKLRRTLSIADNVCRLKGHIKRLERTPRHQRLWRWVRLRRRIRPTPSTHKMRARQGATGSRDV